MPADQLLLGIRKNQHYIRVEIPISIEALQEVGDETLIPLVGQAVVKAARARLEAGDAIAYEALPEVEG